MTGDNGWSVTTLLCDYAQVADGKLFISGGGWSVVGPGPFTHGLAIKVLVPWGEANRVHVLRAVLQDEDGHPAVLGDAGAEIRFESQFEVGRPPGLPPGTALDLPMALNIGPIALPAGHGFAWSITIDEGPTDHVPFRTRAA